MKILLVMIDGIMIIDFSFRNGMENRLLIVYIVLWEKFKNEVIIVIIGRGLVNFCKRDCFNSDIFG